MLFWRFLSNCKYTLKPAQTFHICAIYLQLIIFFMTKKITHQFCATTCHHFSSLLHSVSNTNLETKKRESPIPRPIVHWNRFNLRIFLCKVVRLHEKKIYIHLQNKITTSQKIKIERPDPAWLQQVRNIFIFFVCNLTSQHC